MILCRSNKTIWAVCTRDCVAVAVDRVNSSTRVSATAVEAPLPCSPSPPLLFPKSVEPQRQATISAPPGRSSPGRQALVTWIGAAGIVPRRKPSCRAGSFRRGWLVWSGLGGLSGSWRSCLGNSGSWWNWSR
ncbi:hypothetical protein VPH35_015466 [Triticum aestivum]